MFSITCLFLLLVFINIIIIIYVVLQRNNRDDRFANLGVRDPSAVKVLDDGYISDEDNVAVLYNEGSEKRPKYRAWYGVVHKLRYEETARGSVTGRGKKTYKSATRLHIDQSQGSLVCSWYVPVMGTGKGEGRNTKHLRHNGKLAFRRSAQCAYGYNDSVSMYNVISPVIMKYDEGSGLWLLDKEDEDYVKANTKEVSQERRQHRPHFNSRKSKASQHGRN